MKTNLKGFHIGLSIYIFIIMLLINLSAIHYEYTGIIGLFVNIIFGGFGVWQMYLAFSKDLFKEE